MTVFARSLLDAKQPIAVPIANAFSTTVTENTTNNNMPLNVTGGPFTSVTVSTGATNGTATVSGSTNILYTPHTNFTGSDTFDYTATGPGGTSAPALASITVNPPPAPVAHAFSTSVNENTSGNNMPLSITGVFTSVTVSTAATNGTATVVGSTAIHYTPTPGYVGGDTFDYTATGPGGTSAPALATITVNFVFTPVTNTYSSAGSFTETVPTGASTCVITVWGGGGGGVFLTAGGNTFGAGGAGQAVSVVSVTGGQTFPLTVGGGGTGVTNATPGGTGTASTVGGAVSMTANGGNGATSLAQGTGGTATGGNTSNTTGGNGSSGTGGAGANGGGAGGVFGGAPAAQPGGGGGAGGNGALGQISFAYT